MAVTAACLSLTACGGLDSAVEDSLVFTAERPGGFVFHDSELSDTMVGGRLLGEDIVATAACHSLLGHASDWNVRPYIVASSRLDLVRAAELAADGEFDRSVVESIEEVLFTGSADTENADAVVRFSHVESAVVELYLTARSQPPSADALTRFAVYVGNNKLETQKLVVVDRSLVAEGDFPGMHPQYRTVPFMVAGDTAEYGYTRQDCDRLV